VHMGEVVERNGALAWHCRLHLAARVRLKASGGRRDTRIPRQSGTIVAGTRPTLPRPREHELKGHRGRRRLYAVRPRPSRPFEGGSSGDIPARLAQAGVVVTRGRTG
jgi:hypothetical protein